jgi:hypothetical protein
VRLPFRPIAVADPLHAASDDGFDRFISHLPCRPRT